MPGAVRGGDGAVRGELRIVQRGALFVGGVQYRGRGVPAAEFLDHWVHGHRLIGVDRD